MRFIAFYCLFLLYCPPSVAHVINESYLYLKPVEQGFDIQWQVEAFFYEKELELDADGNELISFDDLYENQQKVVDYSFSRIHFFRGEQVCRKKLLRYHVTSKDIDTYVQISFRVQCPADALQAITMSYQLFWNVDPQHKVFIRWKGHKQKQVLMIDRNNAGHQIALTVPSYGKTLLRFIAQGVDHIWSGMDHLFFILLLVIPAPLAGISRKNQTHLKNSLRNLLIVITAFTLAHSITLVLSVLELLVIPASIVEPLIALSIVITALNNYFGWIRQYWSGAFVFGLLHGFGFAYLLLDMNLGSGTLGLGLLGFNLGVELGQLLFVLAAFPLFYVLSIKSKQYQQFVVKGLSVILGVIAFFWMLQRLGWV